MMASKHHYISQFHLRQFLDPESASSRDPWLWVGDIATGTVKRRAPKNLAWARGMFDGPGGFEQAEKTIETFLATEVEGPAADALIHFCQAGPGGRTELPPALMRYLAWAAARSLTMTELEQRWAHEWNAKNEGVVEPPPYGIEKIRNRERPHTFEHTMLGTRNDVSGAEIRGLIEAGWKWKLSRDDLLELIHMQAWYFQVRHFPRMKWIVLDAPEGSSFVLGDRPVAWGFRDDLFAPPNMLRHPDVQLFAPLSRTVALLAHNTDFRPTIGVGRRSDISTELVNAVMVAAASKWIVGSDMSTVRDALKAVLTVVT
jgi:hypothetical protein